MRVEVKINLRTFVLVIVMWITVLFGIVASYSSLYRTMVSLKNNRLMESTEQNSLQMNKIKELEVKLDKLTHELGYTKGEL